MCLHNLHQIAGAKDLMAREQHLTNGTVVAEQEIAKYMEYGWPICPAGGRYTANRIGRYPTCTTSGHLVGTMNPGSNRVGGRVSQSFPSRLPHHRTCGSAYGGYEPGEFKPPSGSRGGGG